MSRLLELDYFDSIGIDFDGTLVEHDKSNLLWDYIETYHDTKKFHIITFRTDISLQAVPGILLNHTGGRISSKHFNGIHGADSELSLDWINYNQAMRINDPSMRKIFLEVNNWDINYLRSQNQKYRESKAKICKDLGCGILIDDLKDRVIDGCLKYGIRHLHPDDL